LVIWPTVLVIWPPCSPALQVDDTRKTLSFAVEELLKDVAMEKATWLAARQQNKRSSCSSIALPNTPSTHSPPDSPQHCSDAAARSSTCGSSSSSSSTSDEAGPQLANAAAAAAAAAADWQEPRIGIFVVHNKLKPKKAELPLQVVNDGCYFSGCDILDHWVIYPWDAVDVWWVAAAA
jgi:hypoxanthine phosphoribosyltransferase